MELVFETSENYTKYKNKIYLVSCLERAKGLLMNEQAELFLNKKRNVSEKDFVGIETLDERIFVIQTGFVESSELLNELRDNASRVFDICKKEKLSEILVINLDSKEDAVYASVESMYLTSYYFDKYKSEKKENPIKKIACSALNKEKLVEIKTVSNAVFAARTFINEPVINFNANTFAQEIKKLFEGTSATVNVYDKAWIEKEKMGGLLSVNKGSIDEPRFVHISYNPQNSSEKPIVLVGKGIVYDTGGLSLKPSQFMETMKADMGGAAAVVGTLKALVDMNVAIKIDALIPITDNRPGANACAPGDVVKMRSGLTVEVLNTDAEGRMILADALDYAKELNPKYVIDLATLTGAANMTVGEHVAVYMGTADENLSKKLEETSLQTWEPLVKLPLFDFYEKQIKSEIADLKNTGGSYAGSITAGKFLQKFTDYPWLHLDISGSAFLKTHSTYKGVGGTGFGIRTMYAFLK